MVLKGFPQVLNKSSCAELKRNDGIVDRLEYRFQLVFLHVAAIDQEQRHADQFAFQISGQIRRLCESGRCKSEPIDPKLEVIFRIHPLNRLVEELLKLLKLKSLRNTQGFLSKSLICVIH